MKSLKLVVLAVTLCGFAWMANAGTISFGEFVLVPGGPFDPPPAGQLPSDLFKDKTCRQATDCFPFQITHSVSLPHPMPGATPDCTNRLYTCGDTSLLARYVIEWDKTTDQVGDNANLAKIWFVLRPPGPVTPPSYVSGLWVFGGKKGNLYTLSQSEGRHMGKLDDLITFPPVQAPPDSTGRPATISRIDVFQSPLDSCVGDPHLTTFNGLFYDFQASGDFVLAQVDPDFVVQTRQASEAPRWTNVSVNKAVATRMGNTKVAICLPPELNVEDQCVNPELAQLNIDGEDTELADGESFSTDDGVDVIRRGNAYLITSQSGDSVRAEVNDGWIDVSVGLGRWPSKVRGLLANPNGNVNELETRDGAVLTGVPSLPAGSFSFSFEDFYHRYADSWRVPENESLLSVCCDGNVEPGIPERPFYAKDLEPSVYERARAVCMAEGVKAGPLLDACTLDVAVLGNDAAKVFLDAPDPIAVGNIILDTTPPVISSVSASPNVLWPPNHKMAPVAVAVSASDVSSPPVTCKITSVTSNEPLIGPGSGHTAPDWQITGDLSVNLRAERSGTGNGRVYTLAVQCTDASNNSSSARTTVSVPHKR
jgi:hypothetical protein